MEMKSYEIQAYRYDDYMPLDEKTAKSIGNALRALNLYEIDGNDKHCVWEICDTWRYMVEDLCKISYDHRDVLFSVYYDDCCGGELYVAYFLNGLCQIEAAKIEYPDVDKNRLGEDGRYEPQEPENNRDTVAPSLDEVLS